MPGPLPKPANQRRRPNAAIGAAKLHAASSPPAPPLPFEVSDPTAAWWSDIWSSEMSPEWLPSDIHGLHLLARLVDDYWTAPDATGRAKLATEIRLQRQCYGLTPIDRRRLAWSTERTDAPAPTKPAPAKVTKPSDDPRKKVI